MQEVLKEIKEVLLSQQDVAIISHMNPDGDTLGSQLALAGALIQKGINVLTLNNDTVSKKYNFVEGAERIRPIQEEDILPDVVVFVDCATMAMAGYSPESSALTGKTIINIDHHTSNVGYGKLNYVKENAAANCQNIYEVLQEMDCKFTPEIATALYMGLSTDTGNFLFSNVTSDTLRIAAAMKDCGANTDAIRENMYESCSRKRMALLRFILNNLKISENGKYAWSKLSHEMLEELQPDSTDIDGLINTIKDIEDVEVAVLFRGVESEKTKISLRSKAWADVNQIAQQFGGGGHVRAAGCTILSTVEDAADQLIPAVKEYLEKEGH